jgi:hypothetical protein
VGARVEFHRPDDEERTTVATAIWSGGEVVVSSADEDLRDPIVRAFRRTPVVVPRGADRHLGTSGPEVIQPGDLEWFRAAAFVRAPAETGLVARLVTGEIGGGFDPASNYRAFEEQIELLVERGDP